MHILVKDVTLKVLSSATLSHKQVPLSQGDLNLHLPASLGNDDGDEVKAAFRRRQQEIGALRCNKSAARREKNLLCSTVWVWRPAATFLRLWFIPCVFATAEHSLYHTRVRRSSSGCKTRSIQ